jgi:dipeptidyl aminopeptidase/acylaminoacyl peptidase
MKPSSLSLRFSLAFAFVTAPLLAASQTPKPPISLPSISLDEFLNASEISGARLSPDGSAAIIGTEYADWKSSTFRHTLWLWTARGGLHTLTGSGSDEDAQWSPDGQWIAFLSDRPVVGSASDDDTDSGSGDAKGRAQARTARAGDDDDKTTRIWLIAKDGGEAQPLYREKLDVNAFAWSSDGKTIFLATTTPLTPDQEDKEKENWKDVIRWREQERGDLLLALPVASSLAATAAHPPAHPAKDAAKPDTAKAGTAKSAETTLPLPATAQILARNKLSIEEITPSPDGKTVAFLTQSVSRRMENPGDTEIFLIPTAGGDARQITHNDALEAGLRWSPDGKWLHFVVHAAGGSLDGKYRDIQGRLYRLNPEDSQSESKPERLGAEFPGSLEDFEFLPNGQLIALGLKGLEQQIYRIEGSRATKLPGQPGTYAGFSAPKSGSSLLVRLSSINHPGQVYLAADALHPDQLTALTHFDPIFAERAQPDWQPYTWKSKDGVSVEGVLIYPIGVHPNTPQAKHLRMFTLIHGGPADADGNRFGADWYDWATMAATDGWLVFRPNYRGSSGYGDDFMLQIAPHLVSKPGEDILAGVDALVKDGLADPNRLAVGGYSYGGYMTNWLITETTRFKAAVTGAGAVEHAANWGNDDVTFDDAWYLNGKPWENPNLYQSEAALFRMNRVKTPTHIVQGSADVRVSYLEGVTLERALEQLGIEHSFLVFPGEGHGLGRNPWHGYIKVREELKWLDKYVAKQ